MLDIFEQDFYSFFSGENGRHQKTLRSISRVLILNSLCQLDAQIETESFRPNVILTRGIVCKNRKGPYIVSCSNIVSAPCLILDLIMSLDCVFVQDSFMRILYVRTSPHIMYIKDYYKQKNIYTVYLLENISRKYNTFVEFPSGIDMRKYSGYLYIHFLNFQKKRLKKMITLSVVAVFRDYR